MPNNSGIFSLSGYNDKNLEGLIPDKTRESFREYGYFGGGVIGPGSISRSTVDRIDYSNDTNTASARGPLLAARGYQLGGTGNSNFGYFGGGWNSTNFSTVYRTDYSNDSASPTTRGPLSLQRYNITATGNPNFGYFSGGYSTVAPLGIRTFIDRIDYSNDLNSALVRSRITSNRINMGGTSNSNFGYFGGGTGVVVTVDRLSYSNDTQQTLVRGPLSQVRSHSTATGNSNFGYFGGGWNFSGVLQLVDRINYSNDTAQASPRGSLTLGRTQAAATGNSNFGYFGGGSDQAPSSRINFSQIQRVDYSNDTVTTSTRGNHTSAVSWHAATSSASFGGSPISQYGVFPKPFGYFGGGSNPSLGGAGRRSKVDRVDYSNDTATASTRGPLTLDRGNLAGTGNGNFGYFGGGYLFPNQLSLIDRIDYLNDTSTASVRGPLSLARSNLAATGNSNFGWFGGGTTPGSTPISVVDRINYSNDTATASARGFLSIARMGLSATGTSNFAYYAGGATETPAPITFRSTVDRIDYSNDNATAVSRNNLTIARRSLAAIGNQSFGYFGGGGDATSSTIERLDYSSDTTAIAGRSNLTIPRNNLAATGNNNFGYFNGNRDPSPGASTVERLDYSNDTAITTLRGPLTAGIGYLAATSPTAFGGATDFQPTQTFFDIQSMKRIEDTTNASVKKRALGSFGYQAGGFNDVINSSNITRSDYSNDTSTAITRGNTTYNTQGNSGLSTINFGYSIGTANISRVDRIDYSNDNTIASVRTFYPNFIRYFGCCGNSNFGYIGRGDGSLTGTGILRLSYSQDTTTPILRSFRNISDLFAYSAVGNNNFGYFAGGAPGPITIVDRVDYSNDGVKASIRGPLVSFNDYNAAAGNSNFGYVAGGRSTALVQRINYSNDTTIASVRGPLILGVGDLAGTGTSNFGYFAGSFSPTTSIIQRIDYANDTATASVRGPMNVAKRFFAAVTNSPGA